MEDLAGPYRRIFYPGPAHSEYTVTLPLTPCEYWLDRWAFKGVTVLPGKEKAILQEPLHRDLTFQTVTHQILVG